MPAWTEDEQAFAKALQKELKAAERGMPAKVDPLRIPGPGGDNFVGGGSTDVGDVTLIAPTASIRFPGQVPGAISHHWSSVACNYGSTAWKGLNAGAKAIAASAIDLMTRPEELKKLRTEFEEYVKEEPLQAVPAGGRQAAAGYQRRADEEIPPSPGKGNYRINRRAAHCDIIIASETWLSLMQV